MNSQSNTSTGTTGPEFYASGTFYGIKFFNEVKDALDFDRKLPCIPDIYLTDSNTKILLDYTSCVDPSGAEYLEKILNGISLGAGFTLQNAKYIDPVTGVESDLSGYYTYGATFDNGIYGTVADVPGAEDFDKKYSSDGFFDYFNAIFEVNNADTTERNVIKNFFGSSLSPSFTSLGLKIGDYVKILNGTNSSTTKLYEVTNFYKDFNDHEVVQFGNTADFLDENRVGSSTELRLYRVDETASSTQTTTILDAVGNAVAIDRSTITNLNGRVNFINFYVKSNKFYALSYEAPTILLNIGSTYVFNLTDSSLLAGNHTLRISSTRDGKWNNGSVHPDLYVTDNVLVFEPKNSGTFYYYCENHPNMGGVLQVASYSVEQSLRSTPTFINNSSTSSQIQSALTSGIYQ